MVDCFAEYNPGRVKYDVFSNWSIDDPLATEAASVTGYRVRIRQYRSVSTTIEEDTNVRQIQHHNNN